MPRASPDRVGDAAAVRELQRRRLPVIIALTVLILLLHLMQWGMEQSAQSGVERVRAEGSALRREADELAARLAAAPKEHPRRYLAGLSLEDVPRQLGRAEAALNRATRARHPAEKARLAAEAEAALRRARAVTAEVRQRLDRLDTARSGYAEAARRLETALQVARQTVRDLESARYRPDHFATARALIAEAEQRSEEVRSLLTRARSNDVPYLEIYEKSAAGQARAEEAQRLARAVEELRRNNEARARELLDRVVTVRSQYDAARYAAARLAMYPAYASILGEVQRGRAALNGAAAAAREASQANDMDRQAFRQAAELLTEGERQAGAAAHAFARAVETERLLTTALAVLLTVQTAAEDELEDARRRIDRYDHLDQDRALRLYAAAADRFRQAETRRHFDPIGAVELYREARSLSAQAYRSVRTSEPSSGGGSGGWSGGGSTGPSGGSYGGPSGGSYGGPSGGSYGGGGF
jgi:hypothetical protein